MPPKKKAEVKNEKEKKDIETKEEKPKRKYQRKKKEEVKLEEKEELKEEKIEKIEEIVENKEEELIKLELKTEDSKSLDKNIVDEEENFIELSNVKNNNGFVFSNEKKKDVVYNKNKYKSVSFFKFSDYLNSDKKMSDCDTVDLLRCAIAKAHVDNQLQLKNVLFQTLKASKLECEFPLTADSKYKNYFKNKQFNKEKKNFI